MTDDAKTGTAEPLEWDEAMALAKVDRDALAGRLNLSDRPSLVKRVSWQSFANWSWWVEDSRDGTVLAGPSRAYTEHGAWKRAHKAYLGVIRP